MEFKINPYIVYVKINSHNYITSINSSAFLNNINNWIKIDEGYSDKYHHAQNNYFSQSIIIKNGVYRYKLVNNKPVECTVEEIKAQEKAIQELINSQPSQNDLIEAQIMYTAMMTDTLLV